MAEGSMLQDGADTFSGNLKILWLVLIWRCCSVVAWMIPLQSLLAHLLEFPLRGISGPLDTSPILPIADQETEAWEGP